MEKLTVSEVTDLLRAAGIPDSLLTVLAGMLYCMDKFCAHVCILLYVIIISFHTESH